MTLIIVVVHIIVCIALIMIVLLQTGKGADIGAAFGGGSSQTLFGSTGASTFLSKATTFAAVLFMMTSLALGYISGHQGGSSIMMEQPPVRTTEETPAATETQPAAPATEETTQSESE